ncbi:MAG: DUF2092 domain-containing protein [Thermodesulfobacteriota bacterium]
MIKKKQYLAGERIRVSLFVMVVTLLAASPGLYFFYPEARAQDASPNIDSKAASILHGMSDLMGSKDEYTFKANIMYDDLLNTQWKIQYDADETVFIKKPDKFYIGYVTNQGGYKLWYDGGQATLLEVPTNDFSLTTLPGSIDQALTKLKEQYQFTPALSEFLFINTYKVMTANVITGAYLGTSDVFGAKCHHLLFVEKDINWQIWIEDGKRPVPRKLVINYKNLPESPQFIAVFKDWILGEPITNSALKPDIPNINSRVEFNRITGNPKFKLGTIRAFH